MDTKNKIHNIGEYYVSKKKEKELSEYLDVLDKIANLLYDNLGYSESWALLNKVEDARLKYGLMHYEHELIVKNKGKLDE